MIKLTNVYIPNSTIILKFTGNHHSEDIAERIDPEYSDNDMTASTQFQGMANWNLENDKLNTSLEKYKVSSIDASDLINDILKDQRDCCQQEINIWENRPLSIDQCKFILMFKAKDLP